MCGKNLNIFALEAGNNLYLYILLTRHWIVLYIVYMLFWYGYNYLWKLQRILSAFFSGNKTRGGAACGGGGGEFSQACDVGEGVAILGRGGGVFPNGTFFC